MSIGVPNMVRTISILLLGAIVGAGATYFLFPGASDSGLQRVPKTPDSSPYSPNKNSSVAESATPELEANIRSHEGRQAIYNLVTEASASELIKMISDAAAIENPSARRISTEILLARFAELDPREAIRLSRTAGAGSSITASLYATWARFDRDEALEALRDESDAAVARQAAVLLVEEFGGNHSALLDVIDALPSNVDKAGVEIDVLVAQAGNDLDYAMLTANQIADPRMRMRAWKNIARKMAVDDPLLALSAASQVVVASEREDFAQTVVWQWATRDPNAVLDYVATLDLSGREAQAIVGYALSTLAEAEPERLLTAAESWPAELGERARYWALRRWAEYDPQQALAHVENQPPGRKRDELMSFVARGYGEADPEAALAWANRLPPTQSRQSNLLYSVFAGVAKRDPDYALDLALALEDKAVRSEAVSSVLAQSVQSGTDVARIADMVLALDDQRLAEQAMQYFGHTWARQDPAAAFDWMVANRGKLAENTITNFSRVIADYDPEFAAGLTNRVPADLRADWISRVAAGYAQSDPERAMNWLGQYQGQPGYERAVTAVIQHSAQRDPQAAARNINRLTDTNHALIVANTASRMWARDDPEAAARWADTIQNEAVRGTAAAGIATQWAYEEPDRAAEWVLTMPYGAGRDQALSGVLSGVARKRVPDDALLTAFSDDMARQQAVVSTIHRLARVDRAAADRLLEKYVSDPTLLYQARQRLAALPH